jgi:nicotinate-nucleotide adenylyltransferase
MSLQKPVEVGASMATESEVALLGGSFNPPHVAHMMAAYWTLATQGISEVWLLPSFRHPFGKALAPFEDRVRMCELAARAVQGVQVCTAEAELAGDPLVGKTARTLEHLVERHPALRFALVIGADIVAETEKWYRWDRIVQLARIIVVGRQGHPEAGVLPPLPGISSTDVRSRIGRGESVAALVPAPVIRYIEERGLYR